MSHPVHVLLATIPLVLLAGCGGSDGDSNKKSKAEIKKQSDSSISSPKAKSTKPEIRPDTPDGAIKSVIAGFRENRVEALWDFLPSSYQADVSNLIAEAAEGANPEIWEKVVNLLKRATVLAKKQRTHLIGNQNMLVGMSVEQKTDFWDQTIALADLFLASELANLDKVRSLDVGKFLARTGNDLLKQVRAIAESGSGEFQMFQSLAELQVTLVKQDGDSATIHVEGPDIDAHENQLVRIDGKWVPEKFARQWPKVIADLKEQIAHQKPIDAKARQELLDTIKNLSQILDKFEKVESQKDFDAELIAAVRQFVPQPAVPVEPVTGKPQSVTVIIESVFPTDAEDKLITLVKQASDDAKLCDLEMIVEGGQTVLTVSPVSDIHAFAKKLTFGKVASVDDEKLIVVIKPANK